ncbi:MAG: universal stress protein [Chloroflexi bacterium]|nr:universal stress protein [Chloroflexota bacterium]MCI0646624.1 universal stress protein [Chloroflexota bacterium]
MKTLICIRGLPYTGPTIQFGGLIAGLEGSPVTLMTVVQPGEDRAEAEARLAQAAGLLPDVAVSTTVRQGAPLAEILQEARTGGYDVIVVGSRDMSGLIDGLLGTLSRKVSDRAQGSVLVVKEGRPALKRILICTGGQQLGRAVVETGARLARAAGAEATLLHVTNPVPTMYTGLEAIEETLEELLHTDTPVARHLRWSAQHLAEAGVPAEMELQQGVASDEILREARQGNYDLIVIGARAAGSGLKGFLMDQVTPEVVDRAPCPVLVVRVRPDFDAKTQRRKG